MGKKAGDQDGTHDDQHDDLDEDLLDEDDDDLDEDDDLDDDDSDDEDGDEDDDTDEDEKSKGKKKYVTREDLDAAMQKVGDRLVNTVLKEVRGGDLRRQQNRGTAGDKGQKQEQKAPVADVRGARLAFRDYLSDEAKFTSREERRFAMDLGQAMIRARALDGFEDEDKVGREVAEEVAEQVTSLRKHYQRSTIARLRSRGLLAPKKDGKSGQSGQGTTGGSGATTGSQFTEGAELAKTRHARPGAQK